MRHATDADFLATRRDFLCSVGPAAWVLGSWARGQARPVGAPARKPNVIFILADDLGWRDLACTGSRFYKTPHIDRLRQRGVFFTDAYAANPLCSPTRASILTGLWPARIGITAPVCHEPVERLEASVKDKAAPFKKTLACDSATRLKLEYVTIAEILKENGYVTGHLGKWHLGPEPYDPLHQGFDSDQPHTPGPGPAGSYIAPWRFKDFKERTPGEHIEDRMGDEAVAFIQENVDQPFFLNYCAFSVHAPFNAKEDLIEKYRAEIDPDDPQRSPTYAAMVQSLDDNVGKILDTVDRSGIADNTIIVFFSDNGGNMYNAVDRTSPTSNAPLRGGKATIYEGGTRVPCFVVWPGVANPNSTCDEIIQSIDWMPTILGMLGIQPEPDQRFDGISIVPALKGDSLSREAIFCFFPHQPAVPEWKPASVYVRKGDWKLIRIFFDGDDQGHRYELYNLKHDIGETNNLASRYPKRVRRLDALIEKFLEDSKAVQPKRNPAYRPDALESVSGWKAGGNDHVSLSIENGSLRIHSTGNDPQILTANDLKIPQGPYALEFRMRAKASGDGQVFCPGPDRKVVPGTGVPFQIQHDDAWHEIRVDLPQKDSAGLLRLDPGSGEGVVSIEWIRLLSASGQVILEWTFRP